MFQVIPDIPKITAGKFTESKQYPVLEVKDVPGFGLQFIIPDDNGEIRQYKAEHFRYVWTESQQSNSTESQQRKR